MRKSFLYFLFIFNSKYAVIKIKPEKALKLSKNHLTPGRYPVHKICPPKKRRQNNRITTHEYSKYIDQTCCTFSVNHKNGKSISLS